jgi:hypothetical protein
LVAEKDRFEETFKLLEGLLGTDTFKRYEGAFNGGFSIAAFEAISHGVSMHLESLVATPDKQLLVKRIKAMWSEHQFADSTKAGTRGSTRLSKLLPFAKEWFNT